MSFTSFTDMDGNTAEQLNDVMTILNIVEFKGEFEFIVSSNKMFVRIESTPHSYIVNNRMYHVKSDVMRDLLRIITKGELI